MDLRTANDSQSRFVGYVEGLVSVIGHADRAGPLRDYCVGLMLPCERKSVEPMAAVTAPERTAAQHQSLLHFVGNAGWSDERVLAKVREMVLSAIERHGPIEAWIIDDTGFPKQGRHSVGVARQYCGQLGKQANCQVTVSLSIANHCASLPVAYRLYLPQDWTKDRQRRKKAGVPKEIGFKTKPEIALEQIRWACEAGLAARGRVDGRRLWQRDRSAHGYDGVGIALRRRHSAEYIDVAIRNGAAAAQKWSGRGRPPKLIRRDGKHQPDLGQRARSRFAEASLAHDPMAGRFGRVAVLALRSCARSGRASDYQLTQGCPEEWLLIEWPEGEAEPTKYWLSTLAKDISFRRLVDLAKMRWRIERDYQELKQEVGLGHFEGAVGAASITTPRCALPPTDS